MLAGWDMEDKTFTKGKAGKVEIHKVTKDTNSSLYMNVARSRR